MFCGFILISPLVDLCGCGSGRDEEPSGAKVLRLIQIRLATLSLQRISPACQTKITPPRVSPLQQPRKRSTILRVRYWEIIADKLCKAGWSWGCVSAIDSNGRTIWIAGAHRGDGKRLVVHADEKLTAFVELESAYSREVKM
jgi:hypothetical protein